MELLEYLKTFVTNPALVVIGVLSLIEIAPIQVNPWGKIFKWIGHLVVGDIDKKLSELKSDFEQTKANDMRWNVLNFANQCRRGEDHSQDEWRHVISQISEYEHYTEEKGIDNGVMEADSKYLRDLYIERIKKNDFL